LEGINLKKKSESRKESMSKIIAWVHARNQSKKVDLVLEGKMSKKIVESCNYNKYQGVTRVSIHLLKDGM